jgi:hypothetical protein
MPTIRSNWLTQEYRWSEGLSNYIGANGKMVSRAVVNAALEQTVIGSQSEMVLLSERLQSGSLSITEWRAGMAEQIKIIQTSEAALARGGWVQMTQSDWGWVGSQVKAQYKYLDNFARQIANGEQPLNGRFLQRAKMYAQAGRAMFQEFRRRYMRIYKGATEERRVLGVAEHCTEGKRPGCVEQAALGFLPVGSKELVPIGGCTCLTACHCFWEARDENGKEIGG